MRTLPKITVAVTTTFAFAFACLTSATADDFKYWGMQDESVLRGNLVYVDITSPDVTVVLRDQAGENHRVALSTLSPRSQTQAWAEAKTWATAKLEELKLSDAVAVESPLGKKLQGLISASESKLVEAARADAELQAQIAKHKELRGEIAEFTAEKRALGDTVETWTSDNGHQTRARLIVAEIPWTLTQLGDQLDGRVKTNLNILQQCTVVLKDETGKTLRVPFNRLSKESQQYAWQVVLNRSKTPAWTDGHGNPLPGKLADIQWDADMKQYVFHWQTDVDQPTSLCTADNFSASCQLKLAAELVHYPQAIAARRESVAAAEAATIARINQAKPKDTAIGGDILDIAASGTLPMPNSPSTPTTPMANPPATTTPKSPATELPPANPLLGHWRAEVPAAPETDDADKDDAETGNLETTDAVPAAVDWYISKDTITRVTGKESTTRSFRPKYADNEIHVLEILGADKETYVFMLSDNNPSQATCVIGEGKANSMRVSLKRIDGRQKPF